MILGVGAIFLGDVLVWLRDARQPLSPGGPFILSGEGPPDASYYMVLAAAVIGVGFFLLGWRVKAGRLGPQSGTWYELTFWVSLSALAMYAGILGMAFGILVIVPFWFGHLHSMTMGKVGAYFFLFLSPVLAWPFTASIVPYTVGSDLSKPAKVGVLAMVGVVAVALAIWTLIVLTGLIRIGKLVGSQVTI